MKSLFTHLSRLRAQGSVRIYGLIAILLLGAVALFWLPHEEKEAGKRGGGAVPVLVETLAFTDAQVRVEALGTVFANEFTELRSKVTERIEAILFEDGQWVKKDTVLIQLNDAEQRAELAEAQAQLDERTSQLARVRSVEGSGALSKSVVDEETARYNIASAKVELIEARVRDRRIVAPFDGQLGLRNVSVGSLVTSNDTLITLTDVTRAKVDFTLPERYLGSVAVGQTIHGRSVAYPNSVFTGVIDSIEPQLDVTARAIRARAIIENADQRLRPGMLLEITLELESRRALTVAESAIVPLGQQHFVFRIAEDGTAERVAVELGVRNAGRVELLSGVAEGDRIVTHGQRVRPGLTVQIQTPEAVFKAGEL